MGSRPLVSIIINNYNYERYLAQSIESALNQTYQPLEVLVVDDGSTDGSRELIGRYAGRVKPVFKENGGQASAFNAGFPQSQGELVMYLDADDYLKPNAIETAVAHWREGMAVLMWRLQGADAEGSALDRVFPPRNVKVVSGNISKYLAKKGDYVHPPTSGLLFARATLQAILPIDEKEWRISADAPLYTIAPFLGEVGFVDEILGYYRLHGANLWNTSAPDLRRLLRSITHEHAKAELIRQYAQHCGIKPNPYLGYTHPRTVLTKLFALMLGLKVRGMEHDTFISLMTRGVRAALTYPYDDRPFKTRLNTRRLFLQTYGTCALLPKERAVQVVLKRLFPNLSTEHATQILKQAELLRSEMC